MDHTDESQSYSGQRMLWAGGVVACIVLITLGVLAFREQSSRLLAEPIGAVPDFTLTERSGQEIHKNDLLGKVWIADLIYTSCTAECPLLSSRMAQLQAVFSQEKDVRLVSVTVDPTHDTPAVLQRYAERYGAHPSRWLFLTGSPEAIYRLAQQGFRLGVQGAQTSTQTSLFWQMSSGWGLFNPTAAWAHHDGSSSTEASILHSNRLVLVGRLGHIWSYYDGTQQAAIQALQHDVHVLLAKH